MFYSWACITLVNWAWVIYLFTQRDRDHRLTVWFFATYAISDAILWTMSYPVTGGLGWIIPGVIDYYTWIVIVNSLWLTWFAVPLLVSCKLCFDKVPIRYYLIIVFLFSLAWSESFGVSTYERRFVMHVIFEPFVLILSMVLIARYVAKQIREGARVDFLSYAVALTSMILLLKLGLLFSDAGLLKLWQSHTFHFLFMTTVVLAYFGHRRLKRWLLFR